MRYDRDSWRPFIQYLSLVAGLSETTRGGLTGEVKGRSEVQRRSLRVINEFLS